MEEYDYHVESGQFSYDFRAPLLGKPNDTIKIYDFDYAEDSAEIIEAREFTITGIDRKNKLVDCIGDIFD